MLRSEFVELLKENSGNSDVADGDYLVIEHVYNNHPAIADKKHMVELYLSYGMSVIHDMVGRADRVLEVETKIQKQRVLLEELKGELKEASLNKHIFFPQGG